MSKKKNDGLDEIKLFIAHMLTEEQSVHSRLIEDLSNRISGTTEYEEALKILTKVYDARRDILEKLFKKVQELE
jgi:predicted DNA-binding protein YlxM (UPF0122 family)